MHISDGAHVQDIYLFPLPVFLSSGYKKLEQPWWQIILTLPAANTPSPHLPESITIITNNTNGISATIILIFVIAGITITITNTMQHYTIQGDTKLWKGAK